jgi:hypothetical protein
MSKEGVVGPDDSWRPGKRRAQGAGEGGVARSALKAACSFEPAVIPLVDLPPQPERKPALRP